MNGKNGLNFNTSGLVFLVLIASALAIWGYCQPSQASTGDRIYFMNPGGAVLFNHQHHADQSAGCESCHHHLYNADISSECADCHDDDVTAEEFAHAELLEIEDHECSFCHELHDDREPQNCRQCHLHTADESASVISCSSCHECEEDSEDCAELDLTHEEMLDVHENDCTNCHQLSSISSVYHLQCINCHQEERAEIFGKDAGEWNCQACHLNE